MHAPSTRSQLFRFEFLVSFEPLARQRHRALACNMTDSLLEKLTKLQCHFLQLAKSTTKLGFEKLSRDAAEKILKASAANPPTDDIATSVSALVSESEFAPLDKVRLIGHFNETVVRPLASEASEPGVASGNTGPVYCKQLQKGPAFPGYVASEPAVTSGSAGIAYGKQLPNPAFPECVTSKSASAKRARHLSPHPQSPLTKSNPSQLFSKYVFVSDSRHLARAERPPDADPR